MASEHNFIARFSAADQLGQLPLGVAYGNQHVIFPPANIDLDYQWTNVKLRLGRHFLSSSMA
jgi:hypothetical protein